MDANDLTRQGRPLDARQGTVLQAVAAVPPANGAPATSAAGAIAQAPSFAFDGTLAELKATDFPARATIATVGPVPIHEGTSTLIFAPANLGKTSLGFHVAIQVARAGGSVLIFQAEGDPDFTKSRLARIERGQMCDGLGELAANVVVRQGGFPIRQYREWWASVVATSKPTLVVFDPFIDYSDADENSAADVRSVLQVMALAKQHRGAVVVVHHATKLDKDGNCTPRGSSDFTGWTDCELMLSPTDEANRFTLTHKKMRHGAKAPPTTLEWRYTDEEIVLTTEAAVDDAAKQAVDTKRKRALAGALLEAGPSGATTRELRAKIRGSHKDALAYLETLEREGKAHHREKGTGLVWYPGPDPDQGGTSGGGTNGTTSHVPPDGDGVPEYLS